jgi:hypothetical protein
MPDDYPHYFNNESYQETSEVVGDMHEWYTNLTDRISKACPHLRTVRVWFKPGAYTYCQRLDDGRACTWILDGDWDHGFERQTLSVDEGLLSPA